MMIRHKTWCQHKIIDDTPVKIVVVAPSMDAPRMVLSQTIEGITYLTNNTLLPNNAIGKILLRRI